MPASKIEIHHHCVDGDARDGDGLMDWPVTTDYCRAFARHIGAHFQTSWREGGIEREMLRENQRTAPVVFFKNGDRIEVGGVNGPLGTRLKFPQQSASLQVRWCSSAGKIDVGASYLRNDATFRNCRTLVVTGERAEESSARARYATFEPHRVDARAGKTARHVDHWRPVHDWEEAKVWAIIQRFGIVVHPGYHLGFSRISCLCCVFASKSQWATIRMIARARFDRIAAHEAAFGVTIHRALSVVQQADLGTPFSAANGTWVDVALATTWGLPITTDC